MEQTSTPKDVFQIREDGGKSYWTKIGAAFTNRDGSLNAYLDALPLNGKIQIRDRKPKKKENE
jgi:hypothetical protein